MQRERKSQQAGSIDAFQSRKELCLSKRDRSSAGRIDPKAVDICAAINAREEYYTTSSCAGRCFLYSGDGIKAHHHFSRGGGGGGEDDADDAHDSNRSSSGTTTSATRLSNVNIDKQEYQEEEIQRLVEEPKGLGFFHRFRVNHDIIRDEMRYFDFSTLDPDRDDFDPSGGGDPVRSVAQYDYKQQSLSLRNDDDNDDHDDWNENDKTSSITTATATTISHGPFEVIQQNNPEKFRSIPQQPIWLRFEPFILHVMCRSLSAAQALMNAARPAFKNVGLTSWKHGYGRYIVAIWGDEGLDLPLTTPHQTMTCLFQGQEAWLKELVNQRHYRNWKKIERFVQAVKAMPQIVEDEIMEENDAWSNIRDDQISLSKEEYNDVHVPKRFDVVGDVALLHSIPDDTKSEDDLLDIGNAVMKRNKHIKVVAMRSSNLTGTERSPGEQGMKIIAGALRSPLITSHMEYGIKCVVDLNHTFFSPRMGPERLRICQQVARGERILVLFCGVGMDAMQIVCRTEATVLAVELNPIAHECALRGLRMLAQNKAVKCPNAAERLSFIHGDALEVMSRLEPKSFDRILAPRPKEGDMDGDLGKGDAGVGFLRALLPLMKDQGECHWYDFTADWEYPNCNRTRGTIEGVCNEFGMQMEVIHVAKVGSVAKRQLRVCMDFRVRVPEKQ